MENFKRLLVYTGTQENGNAISRAFAIALENNAILTLMEVIKPIPRALGLMTDISEPHELEDLLVKDHRRKLLDIAKEYSDTAVPVNVVVKVGDPATEVIYEVLRNDHDLVIKTADGFSTAGRLFGSTAISLLRNCPCAVLLLKPAMHGEFDQVLAAIDVDATDLSHTELNQQIVGLSSAIAENDNTDLHLVAAWNYEMEGPMRRRAGDSEVDAALKKHDRQVRSAIAELVESIDIDKDRVHLHIERGRPATVIQRAVDEVEADLLVMGTVCRTGISGFLIGNTAESVLADVNCSVLAIKPDGFICPMELKDEAKQLA